MPRKKTVETENVSLTNESEENETMDVSEITEPENEEKAGETSAEKEYSADTRNDEISEEATEVSDVQKYNLGVLKVSLDKDEVYEDDKFETLWNELVTFHRTKRILPVIVTGIEKTQLAGNVVVTYYKDQRIIVPMTEMMINLSEERGKGYTLSERLERVCNTMLGVEIDVMIKGMDKKNGSIVASRQEAMLKKREKFYLTPLNDGLPQVREGRIVEARIIGVTQLVARVEIFGVETTLAASELSWDWIPNVSDKFHVGDKLNVLVKEIKGDSADNLRIAVDVKSITANVSMENLSKCTVQNKYIGELQMSETV